MPIAVTKRMMKRDNSSEWPTQFNGCCMTQAYGWIDMFIKEYKLNKFNSTHGRLKYKNIHEALDL